MKTIVTLLILVSVGLAGCTTVNVQPVRSDEAISSVVIRENPKVAVSDFLDVLVDGFQRHSIATRVVRADVAVPSDSYVVDYVARRSWDMAPYLVDASITITRNGSRIAHAEYHLKGKGGFSLMKWQGTRTKIAPVIDELLKDARPGTGSAAPSSAKDYDFRESLRVIKQIYDEGIITKEQYDARVQDVLKEKGKKGEPGATVNPDDAQ
jgi:hypothetical protein